MKIKDYDIDQFGDDNDISLINNGEIFDTEEDKCLTISEIKQLQLFINPIDASVYSFINEEFKRNERYEYTSY